MKLRFVPVFLVLIFAAVSLAFALSSAQREAATLAPRDSGPSLSTGHAPADLQAGEEVGGGAEPLPREVVDIASAVEAPASDYVGELEAVIANQDATIDTLQRLLHDARFELMLCNGRGEGTFGAWLGSILPEERPDDAILRRMGARLADFEGIHLQAHEGLWLAERLKLDDWGTWGEGSPTEVLIRYLGPERVSRELDPVALEELRSCYELDNVFD